MPECDFGGDDPDPCQKTTSFSKNGVKVLTDCSDEQDPDLNSDCYSWNFKTVGPNGYQACEVNKIDVDRYDAYVDANGQAIFITESFEMPTVYFEMPGRFSAGEAASLCAGFTDDAEDTYENIYRNQPPLQTAAAYLAYLNILKTFIEPVGGRVTLIPNYPNLPIRNLSKVAFGNGNCN